MKLLVRLLLALFFIAAGVNHFRAPAIYLGMMPSWLPAPGLMNTVSGAAEIFGGIGLIIGFTRRAAGWGLIALLIAVFPANIHVALQGHMPGTNFSATALWWRLPFQPLLIAAVWWVTLPPDCHHPGDNDPIA